MASTDFAPRSWIVVPVFNGATVGSVVGGALRHAPVIVVDDGSTDGSGAVAKSARAEVLRHPRRQGRAPRSRRAFAQRSREAAHSS